MDDPSKDLCPYGVYQKLLLLNLHLQEPRVGCAARAQIITDFLHAEKYVAGRAWVLPLEDSKRFNAPIEDVNGNPLNFRETDALQGRLTWPWHVAATAKTEQGNVVVFDP
jgi:hypothetical protein